MRPSRPSIAAAARKSHVCAAHACARNWRARGVRERAICKPLQQRGRIDRPLPQRLADRTFARPTRAPETRARRVHE
eukprot:9429172-Lingulodinium_polyedra.AAC.1